MKSTSQVMLVLSALVAFLTTDSVSAFSLTTTAKIRSGPSMQKQQQVKKLHTFPATNRKQQQTSTGRLKSENTANDFMNELEDKAQKQIPDLLLVDVRASQTQLAKNWGWITTSGVLTLALGSAALIFPILASGLAYEITYLSLGASGIISLVSAVALENGHRAKSAISGTLSFGLAYVLATNPGAGLDIITLSMAAAIGFEGIFETALAAKNKDLKGRGWHFVSGVGSTLAGVWLAATIPVSSAFAPGAALGARLTSNGACKIAVGLEGKKIADAQASA
ncbi:protein of unknown function DUF308 containing protein [Nitzschia inconspicua]|uniref:Uncharacterized protein n=1 Tax=Nitzschia inconspicua TaxID=303405 RepID=A0A9K3KDC0_9STRA|nr:protein of unknown function DUF308 containing protein [Nitzschia inconspicua]